MTLPAAPACVTAADGTVAYGRFAGTIADPAIAAPGLGGAWRRKEWHYLSFLGDDAFVAVAIAQLGYLANAFAYVVDRRAGQRFAEMHALAPLGRGVEFAAAPGTGTTRWRKGRDVIAITATALPQGPGNGAASGWTARLDLALGDSRLQGEFDVVRAEALSLVHRLPTGRPAYTHKEAGLLARADLRWGDRRIVGAGLATADWTRAISQRETKWNWACTAHRLPDGRAFGLNLSAHVYDDAAGHSEEDAAWLDGRVHALGGARFEVPADPTRQPWRITSLLPDEFDLRFQPLGARRQVLDFGVIASRFVQPFGSFDGRVRVAGAEVAIGGAFGVVEDHFARW